jgi:hypothetical protein
MKKIIATLLLSAGLLLPASAEKLNICNEPFKGNFVLESGKIWVEFRPFAEAMEINFRGSDQAGYSVSKDPQASLPGSGKVVFQGTYLNCKAGPNLLVDLNQVSSLLGARVIVNKELGTIDVNLANTPPPKANPFDGAAYTLIEYSSPTSQLSKDIQPTLGQVKSEFKSVQHVLCNTENQGSLRQFMKYKMTQDSSFPEVTLVDRQGNVQLQMRGNHLISDGLMREMRKTVKSK